MNAKLDLIHLMLHTVLTLVQWLTSETHLEIFSMQQQKLLYNWDRKYNFAILFDLLPKLNVSGQWKVDTNRFFSIFDTTSRSEKCLSECFWSSHKQKQFVHLTIHLVHDCTWFLHTQKKIENFQNNVENCSYELKYNLRVEMCFHKIHIFQFHFFLKHCHCHSVEHRSVVRHHLAIE